MNLHRILQYSVSGGWGAESPSDEGDVLVRIVRGADFPNAQLGDLTSCPVRFESGTRAAKRTLQAGDIVLEVSGGTADRPTGRTVYLSKEIVESSAEPVIAASFCRLLRINPTKANSRFVYYAFQDFHARGLAWEFQNRSTGIANFQFPRFANEYVLPDVPLPEQQAIAELLGALDDKIAVNSRIVGMTQELLRSIHQQTVGSVVGEVLYTDIADVGGGATPSTKNDEFWGGSIPWVAPSDVTALGAPYLEDTPRHLTESGLAACSSPLYPAGSIFMTSRATIGAFAIPQVPTAVNQGFIVVQPHDSSLKWWLFHEMQRRVPEYMNRANGATFLELPRSVFRTMTVAIPPTEILQSFQEQADVLHARARSAVRESASLGELRDVLLPALMDGRLRVRDAIKQVEGSL